MFQSVWNIWKIRNKKTKEEKRLRIGIIFIIVCFGWIFFRANSLNDAIYIIGDLLNYSNYDLSQLSLYIIPVEKETVFAVDILLSILLVISLISVEYLFSEKYSFKALRYRYRLPVYVIGIWMIFMLGAFEKNEFIYFQF